MRIVERVVADHSLVLVLLALVLCLVGSWVTARLFLRSTTTQGRQRSGWLFLSALTGGVAIWCTHFVAMLGFDSGVPIRVEPVATTVSLFIGVAGSTLGFALAGGWRARYAGIVGGMVVGLSIAAMHYVGMAGYQMQGQVHWNIPHLLASFVFALGFAALAVQGGLSRTRHAADAMAGLLTLAIISLHFTGMAAFTVTPVDSDGVFSDPAGLDALAITIVGLSLVIVAAALTSYLIDDSVRIETVEHLRRMALSDPLTSLPNRTHFAERLVREIEMARADGGTVALVGIDLNNFKDINDMHGHGTGDEVLTRLAERLSRLVQVEQGEFVARTGGDEFAAIVRVTSDERLHAFLARLDLALFQPMSMEAGEIVPGASFGVALWPSDATAPESLINNADLAMYRAKADPTRSVCFYEASMDDRVRERRSLAADLRDALGRGELQLHYQVQRSITTGTVQGYEALMRWTHPVRGRVSPVDFIPLAEETGLIVPMGAWALREACIAATAWDDPYRVAVNISAVQVANADLAGQVKAALIDSGLAPERLELELTESTIFADKGRALHVLNEIRALGVRVALDDFGTGYSSLDTLRSFPFDRIKLDRSFIAEAHSNAATIAVVRAVITLGKSLGIPVLAEGIETIDEFMLLDREGCDEAQGYLLGHPEPMQRIMMPHGSFIPTLTTPSTSSDRYQWRLRLPQPAPLHLDFVGD